jgi:hypothetical protein
LDCGLLLQRLCRGVLTAHRSPMGGGGGVCEQGASYTSMGKEKDVPKWTAFDADPLQLARMIQLNFASARVTHPECRLVILTDSTTELDVDGLTPPLPGPPVELVRMAGMNKKEEMLSRMKARIRFLSQVVPSPFTQLPAPGRAYSIHAS